MITSLSKTKLLFLFAGILCVSSITQNAFAAELLAPSLQIKEIEFNQSGDILYQLSEPVFKVFIENEKKSIDVSFIIKIEDPKEQEVVTVVHTPSNQNLVLNRSEISENLLKGVLSLDKVQFGENSLSIRRQNNSEEDYSPLYFPFIIEGTDDIPSIGKIIFELFKSKSIIILFFILFCTFYIKLSNRDKIGRLSSILLNLILVIEILFLSLLITQQSFRIGLQSGYISNENIKTVVSQANTITKEVKTLTKLDKNGRLKASLSTSWSNISPLVWEFTLSEDLNPQEIILDIQQKSEIPVLRQLLSSVSKIVSSSSQSIQFLMSSPDPLLAHKLTQVAIRTKKSNEEQITSSISSSKTLEIDNKSFESSEILQLSLEEQKELISEGRIDSIIEPNPGLWPLLFQKKYQIVPEVNTVSIALISRQSHPLFQEGQLLVKLRKALQSGAVLQTSYLQYGQLASQFARPGVTGYDPELIIPFDTADNPEIEAIALSDEQSEVFQYYYPTSEAQLAKVIELELIRLDVNVKSTPYTSNELESLLLKENIDLLLLEYDFILGDVGPFLDTFVDSNSIFNSFYKNEEVDELIKKSRRELNQFERLRMLQKIMRIIVLEDPLGVPLLYKRSFAGQKVPEEETYSEKALKWILSI